MRLLALDLGAQTGYALLGQEKRFGTWDLNAKLSRPIRQRNLMHVLKAYIINQKPDAIIYERPFSRGIDATRCGWGSAGIVEALAAEAELPEPLHEAVNRIKKWATGKGTASKEEMIAEARRRGYNVTNDHEADAVLLGLYALEVMEISK